MDRSPLMTALPRLRARVAAAPLDRAPLRRAGALAVLLVLLLVAGRALGPDRPAPADASASRQSVQAGTERVSARSEPSLWTPGRVVALVLLAAGGGFAFVLHRRSAGSAAPTSAIRVLETHTLGPNQSLQLVACGGEVLLLGVTGEGTRVLRHWPRDRFEQGQSESDDARETPAVRFVDALASELADAPDAAAAPTDEPPAAAPSPPPERDEDTPPSPEPAPSPLVAAESPVGRPHALRQFAAGRA